jgi:N-acyl-L-homoserine lactone synthetase
MYQQARVKTIIENNNMHYSVGILAEGNCVSNGCEEAYLDYLRLRARVYGIQNDFISKELILKDGTERDEDDCRSVHFAVLEENDEGSRVVAALRLILKNDITAKSLPIEKYFPKAFSNMPVPLNNVELSRYICNHENKATQFALTLPLFSSAAYYGNKHNISLTYAVIEPFLERILRLRGFPVKRLAEQEFLSQYNRTHIPVIFNNKLIMSIIESKNPGMIGKLGNTDGKFVCFEIINQKGVLYENN